VGGGGDSSAAHRAQGATVEGGGCDTMHVGEEQVGPMGEESAWVAVAAGCRSGPGMIAQYPFRFIQKNSKGLELVQ
jgi:hypothetical protein